MSSCTVTTDQRGVQRPQGPACDVGAFELVETRSEVDRDFNGDGKSEFVWQHTSGEVYVWLVDGATISGHGSFGTISTGWTIAGVGDFDGDHKSDLLWRHSTGTVYEWFLNGANILGGGSLGSVTTDWQIQ